LNKNQLLKIVLDTKEKEIREEIINELYKLLRLKMDQNKSLIPMILYILLKNFQLKKKERFQLKGHNRRNIG
jgi:hypothetical protein